MGYDHDLAQRVRQEMSDLPGYKERMMFGGVGFMLHGNMACGVNGPDLIVRVGPAGYESALAEPHTRTFDMTGKPMKGWVVVEPAGCETAEDLASWVGRGVAYAGSLPAK